MKEYPNLKTRLEIERMRLAAESIERVLAEVGAIVRPGIRTLDLEHVAALSLKRNGLEPALPGYQGYPNVSCVSPNNVAAHGLPGDYVIKDGDILSFDVSGIRDGWFADGAWTYGIGSVSKEGRRLIRTAWRATLAGAAAARAGGRIGDIGAAIVKAAAAGGCHVVETCTGHGIGRELHEPPTIPHTGTKDGGMPIVPGMVLNIEPVLTLGNGLVRKLDDGWSYVTRDGQLAAQFEVTVAVGADQSRIVTLGRHRENLSPLSPPYG
jgi:methionyl aminopeptidase